MNNEELRERVKEWLQLGGLFNAELMPADKTRDIIIECLRQNEKLLQYVEVRDLMLEALWKEC